MEQVVISCGGAKGVGGGAMLPAKLIQAQIYEIFTWKNRKDNLAHNSPHQVIYLIIYQNARLVQCMGRKTVYWYKMRKIEVFLVALWYVTMLKVNPL